MEDIKAQLTQELTEIEWCELLPHAQRDALIVVSNQLNLLDVGVAIANNEVMNVQHWIQEQLIHKPSIEQLSAWNLKNTTLFKTLIVQPFVLIQTI